MIICRSPLRITLGGGGTDLPSYYSKHGGMVISAAINKYVFVTLTRPFRSGIYLKYSSIERKKKIQDIKHPLIRETLKELNLENHPLEITTLADIPSGTGLGSSGSFTVSLINAIFFSLKKKINKKKLAELACKIEIEKLKEPSGKQDQYCASFGGINVYNFKKNHSVQIKKLKLKKNTLENLENNVQLFYTGYSRKSGKILQLQKDSTIQKNNKVLENLHKIKKIGYETIKLLENNDLKGFSEIMNDHWKEKKKRANIMSNHKINYLYDEALKNGALGGKLVGAGGGGFLMFYSTDKKKLSKYFKERKIEEVQFKFDFKGSVILEV